MWKIEKVPYMDIIKEPVSTKNRYRQKENTMKDYLKLQTKSRASMAQQQQKHKRKLHREYKLYLNDTIDKLALSGAKDSIETALSLERDAFLGRTYHKRVKGNEFRGYRNGYSSRTIGLGGGQTDIKMPRVSNAQESFESKILPPFLRTSPAVLKTLPQLYLYGLSGGDFREALKALLGEEAVLSPASIMRLKERWYEQYLSFHEQPLDSHYAYLYADGIYMKAGLAKENLALLAVIGVNEQGAKRLLALIPGYRESYENWLDVLRNLKERGVQWIGLVIADGILGLWRAVKEVFPESLHQRDWVHKMRNVLSKLPRDKRLQKRAHQDLLKIYEAETEKESEAGFIQFAKKYKDYPTAVECLLKDKEVLTSYFSFPKGHWRHIKTTNPVESPFAWIRARLRKTKRLRSEKSALGLVFQLMLKIEANWTRLSYPELATSVVYHQKYCDGTVTGLKKIC